MSISKIQMVDLVGQYQKIKTEVDSAIQHVIDTTAFINGPDVKLFATELAEYLQVKHVIPCANGTDALQIAIMALDIPKGSEIIVPAFNYVATAEVIALLDMVPVFVDVHPDTFQLEVAMAAKSITNKTAAIMPVHLFGQCVDMEAVMDLAKAHNLFVIEDTAQAIGASYTFANGKTQTAGTIGHVGTTSFFPSKNLGCMGDGGAIFTNDDTLASKIRTIANHGQKQKYTYETVGVNSRLDTMQAAILRVKLTQLPNYTAARQHAAAYYDQLFSKNPHIQVPAKASNSSHVYHQYTIKIKEGKRDIVKTHLADHQIPSMIYYPAPLHLQQAYGYLGYKKGDFPVAEELCNCVLALPMHTELSPEQQAYIVEKINEGLGI